MFGMNATRPTTTENGTTKTRSASHLRRRQIAAASSKPKPGRTSSRIGQRRSRRPSLRDEDNVLRLEIEVFVLSVRGDRLVVVERNPLLPVAVGAEDDDPAASGVLVQPARQGQDVEHGR